MALLEREAYLQPSQAESLLRLPAESDVRPAVCRQPAANHACACRVGHLAAAHFCENLGAFCDYLAAAVKEMRGEAEMSRNSVLPLYEKACHLQGWLMSLVRDLHTSGCFAMGEGRDLEMVVATLHSHLTTNVIPRLRGVLTDPAPPPGAIRAALKRVTGSLYLLDGPQAAARKILRKMAGRLNRDHAVDVTRLAEAGCRPPTARTRLAQAD